MAELKTFAALLTRYRDQAALSQDDLAREARLDPSYVASLERGEGLPPPVTVWVLARSLGLEADAFDTFYAAAGYITARVRRHWSVVLAAVRAAEAAP